MVSFAFGVVMFKPGFSQTFVNSSTDYPYFRKSLVKHGYTSTASHQEGDEDDVILLDAMVQESADGHECRSTRTNLMARQFEVAMGRRPRLLTCASNRNTQVSAARCRWRIHLGSMTCKSSGSPVLASDCTSREPIATSLNTRCSPFSSGPPLKAMVS